MKVKDLLSLKEYSLVTIAEAGPTGRAMFYSNVKAVSIANALEEFRINGGISSKDDSFSGFPDDCKRFISPLDIKYLEDLDCEVGEFQVVWSTLDYDSQSVEMWYILPTEYLEKFSELAEIPLM